MTELVTSGSVGGMASNGCLYPEVATHLSCAVLALKNSKVVAGVSGSHARCLPETP